MEGVDRIARRIHVAAFAVYVVAIGYTYNVFVPLTQPFDVALLGSIFALFALMWLVAFAWRSIRGRRKAETEAFRQNFYLGHMWLYNVAIISDFWILMPNADDAMQLVGVMFTMGTVSVEAFATTRPFAAGFGARSLPYFLSIGLCLYFAVYWGQYSFIIIVFIVCFTALMLMARHAIKLGIKQLEVAHDTKTRFLASASHDLATPLQSARLFFDQVIRSTNADARDKATVGVNWAFDTTEQIMQQMLQHLKLDSGGVTADIREVAIGPLIAQVAETYELAAHLASISIHALPCRLTALGDATLIERAIGNMVSNAIRHAKARRILIGGQKRGDNLRIWVIDDGVGISDADFPRLFEDYFQGSNHGDEIRGGFGIGLASVRQIAILMGGRAGIDKRWRHGCAFYLEVRGVNTVAD